MDKVKRVVIFGGYAAARIWARQNGVRDYVVASSRERIVGIDPRKFTAVKVSPSTPKSAEAWREWERLSFLYADEARA